MHTDQNMNTPTSTPNTFRPSIYTTSSISDFVHAEDSSPKLQHTLHRPKTNRKTWKSLKEKKEAVWPDYLEEALLEALERYRPTSSKDPRALRRFPKRNAYISNFIKLKTGVLRTPKQVGSRLQQLRETCTEDRIIRLIVSRDFDAPDRLAAASAPLPLTTAHRTAPDLRINTSIPDYSPTSSSTTVSAPLTASLSVDSLNFDPYDYPVTPFSDEFERRSIRSSPSTGDSWPHAYVHIDLVASSGFGRPLESAFTVDLDESGLSDSPLMDGPQRRITVPSALPIAYNTPSVTFSSSILSPTLNYESLFRVHKDDTPLLEECTRLELVSEPHCRPALFRSSVLPKYWSTLAHTVSDLHQYMIIQDVYESAASTDRHVDPIYTIVFNFDSSISPEQPRPRQPVQRRASGITRGTTSSSPTSYFSSPAYESIPLSDDIRIPLAPIMLNTNHSNIHTSSGPSSPELLSYDTVGEYGSLLPSIASQESTPAGWYSPTGYFQPATQFYSSSGTFSGLQSGMDGDGIVYPNLYPF